MSVFDCLPIEPPNPILGLAQECTNDSHPNKINLTIGAYRGEDGLPFVLPSVREAETRIHTSQVNHEYLSQDGDNLFTSAAQKLMFGEDSILLQESRVYSIQTVAGTAAVRLAAEFLNRTFQARQSEPKQPITIALPNITWQNHNTIMAAVGMRVVSYRYVDLSDGVNFDFEGMKADLQALPPNTIVLMHACAHNPSGSDPNDEQWRSIVKIFEEKSLFPFFDNAYQGFVSGNPDQDAYSVRLFVELGLEMIVACSFSKNFGLYGERVGVLHVVSKTSKDCQKLAAHCRAIARVFYSTCPSYGARIVSTILNDRILCQQWKDECAIMAHRLMKVRQQLYDLFVAKNVKGKWEHILTQRGMFSFSGIPKHAVIQLKEQHHVYLLTDGRISLAGLNEGNLDWFAEACLLVLGSN